MGEDILHFYSNIVPSLPPHSVIVEVGIWTGRSLIHLAKLIREWQLAAAIYGVDTFDGGPDATREMRDYIKLHGGSLYDLCQRALQKNDVDDIVRLIKLPSVEAAKQFHGKNCSLVFIDASHKYRDVYNDIKAWLPTIRPGYYLAGHDYSSEGVRRAVDKFLKVSTFGNCWFMRTPAANSGG